MATVVYALYIHVPSVSVREGITTGENMNCTTYASTCRTPPPGWGLHREMPVQVHSALLQIPSRRRWDPDEPLSGVTAAFQCSSLGSGGSHQLSVDVCMLQQTGQNWEWFLWMLRAAQSPAPIGNANNECLKNFFMEIFFR